MHGFSLADWEWLQFSMWDYGGYLLVEWVKLSRFLIGFSYCCVFLGSMRISLPRKDQKSGSAKGLTAGGC